MTQVTWIWLKRRFSDKIKCCGYFSHLLDDRYGASPEALGSANTIPETRTKICSKALQSLKRMGIYVLKAQLEMQFAEASLCIFLWSNNLIINCYPILILANIFWLPNRSNSTLIQTIIEKLHGQEWI